MIKSNGETPMQKVPYKVYHWGPCLARLKLDKKISDMLEEEIIYSQKDFSKNLAGNLRKEIAYTEDSRKRIAKTLSPYFKIYLKLLSSYTQDFDKKRKTEEINLSLEQAWCNYQYAGDYNPPHKHDGRFSFVIYLRIDHALIHENKNFKGTSAGPGGITFSYGDGHTDNITHLDFFPEAYDMFIFPAWLTHFAHPYKHPNIVRTSVSGNVYDSVSRAHVEKSKGKNIILSDTLVHSLDANESN